MERRMNESSTSSARPDRASEMRERIDLLGCPFDVITEQDTVKLVFDWIRDGKTRHIITVNVAILMMAKEDAKLARAIDRADLVVVDGKPLVWTSRWVGSPVPERVSG